MAESSDPERSPTLQLLDQWESRAGHSPPRPTRSESALFPLAQCGSGFEWFPDGSPSVPARGTDCCHPVRWSESGNPPHSESPAGNWDRLYLRWVAFLAKSEEKDAAYENVNCARSTFPISPRTDLNAVKVQSLPDTLIAFYRDHVDFKRAELKEWEK